MNKTKLMLGDNIESLRKLPDNIIDSIVTDPPYGLSFMNKKWDYDVPSVDFWKEAYRVLKPGGHVLSFGGDIGREFDSMRHEDWISNKNGRFPANIIFECICDEVINDNIHINQDCPCRILDEQSVGASRFFYNSKVSKSERNMGLDGFEEKDKFDNKSQMWQNIEGKDLFFHHLYLLKKQMIIRRIYKSKSF